MGIIASNNPFSCDPAIVQYAGTYLVSKGTITYADNFATLSVGFSCKINNVLYANTAVCVLPVYPTLPDLKRVDFIVMNTENSFEVIQGEPYTDVVIEPLVPADKVFVTAINVFGDSVTVQEPISGSQFIKKSEYAETFVYDSGDITIGLDSESTAFVLTGAVTSVIGFEMSDVFLSSNFYQNKKVKLTNKSGGDVTIKHNGAATYPARFPSETDFVWKNNEAIEFNPVKRDELVLEFVSIGRDEVFNLSAKEDVSNKKTSMTGNETSNVFFLSAKAIYDWGVGKFQDILVSGTNIKTVFGSSLLGIGDLDILTGNVDMLDQIEVGTSQNVQSSWNGKVVIFTANCTITVPSSLPSNFAFQGVTLAGVTVTWAITSPKTWLFGTPSNSTEKTTFSFMQRGSTNSIIILQ